MSFPGEEFANEHGYTLWSHNEQRTHMDFVKSTNPNLPVHLDLLPSGEWTLSKVVGMVMCTLGPFSLPNKSFEIFEKQIESIEAVDHSNDISKAIDLLQDNGYDVEADEDW